MNDQAPSNVRGVEKPRHSTGHQLAEWVSLGISTLIILSLAGHLLIETMHENGPIVPVEVRARFGEVQQANGRFVLPVVIVNRGQKTLRDLKIEVEYQPSDSAPATTDLLIDYLGERSEQVTYFYFEADPNALKVKVRPASYRLE